MAEPAQAANTIGSAEIEVRADVKTLERDLARVRQLLEKFDQSTASGASKMQKFEQASAAASNTVQTFNSILSLFERNTQSVVAANDNATAAQKEFTSSVQASQAELKKLDAVQAQNSRSWKETAEGVSEASTSFVQAGVQVLKIAGYLKLASAVAYNTVPAYQKLIDTGMSAWADESSAGLAKVSEATASAGKAVSGFAPTIVKAGQALGETGKVIKEVSDGIKVVAPNFSLASTAMNLFGGFVGKTGTAVASLAPAVNKSGEAIQKFIPMVGQATATLGPFMKIANAAEVVTLASSFGMAGVAATALIKPLREVASHEIKGGLQALPAAAGTVTQGLSALGGAATATESKFGLLAKTFGGTLSFVSKLAVPILAVSTAFKALTLSVELAHERIAKAMELIKISTETGLGVELVQRLQFAAKEMKISTQEMIDSAKKFQEVSTKAFATDFSGRKESFAVEPDMLSGWTGITLAIASAGDEAKKTEENLSELDKRLNKLLELNTNFTPKAKELAEAFKISTDTEERWRTMVKLITELGTTGYRKAALNIASTFASPEVMKNLQADITYLQRAQDKADKLASTKLISAESVARAKDLHDRLEEATRILGERWIPFEEQLVKMGLNFQENWVRIVELAASFLGLLNQIPGLVKRLSSLDYWKGLLLPPASEVEKSINERAKQEQSFWKDALKSLTPDKETIEAGLNARYGTAVDLAPSFKKLTEQLIDPNKMKTQSALVEALYDDILRFADLSVLPWGASPTWDKAVINIKKHIAAVEADAAAVGKSAGFQEQLRVELQLMQAAQNDGFKISREQITIYAQMRGAGFGVAEALRLAVIPAELLGTQFKELGQQAGDAAARMAKLQLELKLTRDAAAAPVALEAITARSPMEKGNIAAKQKRLELELELQKVEKDGVRNEELRGKIESAVHDARMQAIRTEIEALNESARVRKLTYEQAIATSKVEIQAIGKSVGEQQRLTETERLRQQLEAEGAQHKTGFDQAQFEARKKEIDQNAALAQQKAQMNAVDQANFDLQTAFLTDVDKQIASVNRQLHGNAWPAFMEDGLAATMRLSSAIQQFSNTLSSSLTSSFTDIIMGTKNVSQGFKDMAMAILRSITEILVKMTIAMPIARALQAAMGSFLPGAGAVAGGATTNITAGALGLVFERGMLSAFAKGGVVNRPTLFPMAKGGMGLMGEAGPEAIMPLRRGPTGRLGVEAGGGAAAGTEVYVYNYTSERAETTRRTGPNGQEMVEIIIGEVKKRYGTGEFDSANSARYGLRPGVARR